MNKQISIVSTKSAGIVMLIAGILTLIGWAIFAIFLLPAIANSLITDYPGMQEYYYPCFIYFEIMGGFFLASVIFHFLICRNVLKEKALCEANKKHANWIAFCMCFITLMSFLIPILIPAVGILKIFFIGFGLIFFVIAAIFWAIGRIIKQAVQNQESE